jgi:regulatory protein
MRIARIEPVPYRSDRVRLHLEGRRAVDLTRLVVEEAGLRPGQLLDETALNRLLDRDGFQQTLERALRFLETRPRSEREVRTRLVQKGATPELVDQVVERLRTLGLIDDAAFAQYWIENRERFSPRGARALKAELRNKGLANEVIVAEVEDAVDEEAGAREVALRQARRLARLDERTFRQRLWAYLGRRGFDYEAIASAVDQAWTSLGAGEAEPLEDAAE